MIEIEFPEIFIANLPSDIKTIPKKTGIYLLYNKDNELLYVGETVTQNLQQRIGQHISGKSNTKHFYKEIASAKYFIEDCELLLNIYERWGINKLNPKYNISSRYKRVKNIDKHNRKSSELELITKIELQEKVYNLKEGYHSLKDEYEKLKLVNEEMEVKKNLIVDSLNISKDDFIEFIVDIIQKSNKVKIETMSHIMIMNDIKIHNLNDPYISEKLKLENILFDRDFIYKESIMSLVS